MCLQVKDSHVCYGCACRSRIVMYVTDVLAGHGDSSTLPMCLQVKDSHVCYGCACRSRIVMYVTDVLAGHGDSSTLPMCLQVKDSHVCYGCACRSRIVMYVTDVLAGHGDSSTLPMCLQVKDSHVCYGCACRSRIVMYVTDVLAGYGEEMEDVDCGYDGCQTNGLENQACLPIPIPYNDTVFGGGHKPCLMFVRSQQVPSAYTCQLCKSNLSRSNCRMAECFPGKSRWCFIYYIYLPGNENVKRFQFFQGRDVVLY